MWSHLLGVTGLGCYPRAQLTVLNSVGTAVWKVRNFAWWECVWVYVCVCAERVGMHNPLNQHESPDDDQLIFT